MKVDKIIYNRYITPKTTGYSALTGIGLTLASGYSKNKTFRKSHKPLAIVSTLLTLLHVGQIEYINYQWKHKTGHTEQ